MREYASVAQFRLVPAVMSGTGNQRGVNRAVMRPSSDACHAPDFLGPHSRPFGRSRNVWGDPRLEEERGTQTHPFTRFSWLTGPKAASRPADQMTCQSHRPRAKAMCHDTLEFKIRRPEDGFLATYLPADTVGWSRPQTRGGVCSQKCRRTTALTQVVDTGLNMPGTAINECLSNCYMTHFESLCQ